MGDPMRKRLWLPLSFLSLTACAAQAGEPAAPIRGTVVRGGVPVAAASVALYLTEERPGPTVSCGPGEREVALRDLDVLSLCPRAAQQVFHLAAAGSFEDQPVAVTRSDARGRFQLPAVAGSLVLLARVPGGGAGLARGVRAGNEVTVALSQKPVRGAVVEDTGGGRRPLAGAEVLIGVASPRAGYLRVVSGADGAFEALLPADEELSLTARAPEHGAVADTWAPSEDRPLEVRLVRRPRVTGRLTDEGTPVPGAEVRIAGSLTSKLVTDGEGRFSTDEVGLPRLPLEVRHRRGYAYRYVEEAEARAGVELTLESGVPLRVRVTDAETRAPLDNASVVVSADPRFVTELEGSAGLYAGSGPGDNDYTVEAYARGYAPSRVAEWVYRGAPRTFDVRLWRAAELRGRLTGRGTRVAGRGVQACREWQRGEDDLPHHCESTTTSADGAFTFSALRAGRWLVAVLDCDDPQAAPYWSHVGDTFANCSGRYLARVLLPSDEAVVVSLDAQPPATIEVAAKSSRALCACSVSVECGVEADARKPRFEQTRDDSRGQFEVAAGVCIASASCWDAAGDGPCDPDAEVWEERTVEVRPGEKASVVFELEPRSE